MERLFKQEKTMNKINEIINNTQGCFAIKAERMYPNVLPSRTIKYKVSLTEHFVGAISAELLRYDLWLKTKNIPHRVVRIHEAGEMYSNEYVDKWIEIAKLNPKWTFYTFTKRFADFRVKLEELNSLPNVFITDSLFTGSVNYNKTGVVLNKEHKHLFICPATTDKVKCSPEICNYCYKEEGSAKYGVAFRKH